MRRSAISLGGSAARCALTLAVALASVAGAALGGCPRPPPDRPAAGGGSAPEPIRVQRAILSWGISPVGELADIYLAITDETGKQVSHPIGRYKGACQPIVPGPEMGALTGVACVTGGGGTELHAVRRGAEIIVVVLGTMPGVAPDPMAREPVKRVAIPVGAVVDANQ
jgi:hypothetical protein